MTAATAELLPNKLYVWQEVAALTITLGAKTPNVAGEYLFQFRSGSTATKLTVPTSVKWITPLAIQPNKTYQVSILNGLGVIAGAQTEIAAGITDAR